MTIYRPGSTVRLCERKPPINATIEKVTIWSASGLWYQVSYWDGPERKSVELPPSEIEPAAYNDVLTIGFCPENKPK